MPIYTGFISRGYKGKRGRITREGSVISLLFCHDETSLKLFFTNTNYMHFKLYERPSYIFTRLNNIIYIYIPIYESIPYISS